jgi:hypothetical protein
MPAKTRLAQVIAKEEGFGIPNAIPTLRNNPGDLRHSPHSEHPDGPSHANDVGTIDTAADGWADLERQLEIYAEEGLNLRQMVNVYLGLPKDPLPGQVAPDGNQPAKYLAAVVVMMGMPPETLVSEALKVRAQGLR